MLFVSLNVLRKWYFAASNVFTSRLLNTLRPGFQHCSTGFSSGEYFGKYSRRTVFLCCWRYCSTSLPLCAFAPSTKSKYVPHRCRSFSRNLTNCFERFFLLKQKTKLRLLRAPNTFVHLFAWLIFTTGWLPRLAQPRVMSGMRPKVASSCAPTTNPFTL